MLHAAAIQPPVRRTPIDAIADYALRFHSALGGDHAAASPLGAYLLLAAVAPVASGSVREELERSLGCPADEARASLSGLLASPHPAVAPALAVWSDPGIRSDAFDRWRKALPTELETGPVPGQPAADTWARQATRGIIDQFPLQIGGATVLLLASALATEALWESPFFVVPATDLGSTFWAAAVGHVLFGLVPGERAIMWTQSAGLVGVLLSRTTESLLVVSVIAEPAVAPHAAIAAAHEVAALVCARASTAAHRSLFDLPLGTGHAWDIEETEIETQVRGERCEKGIVLIPAWRAEAPTIDLLADSAFGFRSAVKALIECLPPVLEGYEARVAQATTAKFGRHGFSAASATALEVSPTAAMAPQCAAKSKGLLRTATGRFSRPFAVVAVAHSPGQPEHERSLAMGALSAPHPWHGVPVLSVWVTRASEPDESEPTGRSRR